MGPPDDVRGVEVAQQKIFLGALKFADQSVPDAEKGLPLLLARLCAALPGKVPVDEKAGFHLHRGGVEVRNVMDVAAVRGEVTRGRMAVQVAEADDAFPVTIGDRPALLVQHAVLAQVLQQEDALVVISAKYLRCRQAEPAEIAGNRDEGIGVLGKVHDLRIRLAFMDRRSVGLARPVHQDQRSAVFRRHRLVGPHRRIAGQVAAPRVRVSPPVQEGADGKRAADAVQCRCGAVYGRGSTRCLVLKPQCQPVRREEIFGHLRPFDQRDTGCESLVQPQFVEFRSIPEAIKIEMGDGDAKVVALDQGKCRRGNLERLVIRHGAQQGACQCRLSGPEVSGKGHAVARAKRQREIFPEPDGRRFVRKRDDDRRTVVHSAAAIVCMVAPVGMRQVTVVPPAGRLSIRTSPW